MDAHAPDWTNLSDEQLLEKKIRHLSLQLPELEPPIGPIYQELSSHGLVFHPPCHVGDEWFVPIGIPAIYVPFFLFTTGCRRLGGTWRPGAGAGRLGWS